MDQRPDDQSSRPEAGKRQHMRKLPPVFSVSNALKLCGAGTAAGVLLRVTQMLFRYDYQAGFDTDGGLMAWCSLLVLVLTAVFGGASVAASAGYFGPYVPGKSRFLGAVAAISGAALLFSGGLQAVDYLNYLRTGVSAYDSVQRGAIHVTFFVLCFLFGLLQLYSAAGFFAGKNPMEHTPLLGLIGVLWGVAYVVLVYVFYAKSPSMVENLFAVLGGSGMLLSLFYIVRLLAGVDPAYAARRLFIVGIAGVMLTVTYAFSNLALMGLGRSYLGEIPPVIQFSSLGVAAYVLAFLLAYRRDSLSADNLPPEEEEEEQQQEEPRLRAD